MKHLLARKNRALLQDLARKKTLLAFDFDGTLAPIVKDRDAARLRARTLTLLTRLCELYPCAVISGRGRANVQRLLGGARVPYVVGNHGLEPGGDLAAARRDVARACRALHGLSEQDAGIDLEHKQYSLALHYRRCKDKRRARRLIDSAIETLPVAVRVIGGKLVVNLVPAEAPDKGAALQSLRKQAGARVALYAGDDITDEDVFRLDQPGRLLSVRIGQSRRSAAEYYLQAQRDIDRLLATLIEFRR